MMSGAGGYSRTTRGDHGDDAPWLTVTEIARRLARARATVDNWRDSYRAELESRVDADGHAVYRLTAFELIARLRAERRPPAEIRRYLLGDAVLEEPFESASLAELRAIRAAVERIADRLERLPIPGGDDGPA